MKSDSLKPTSRYLSESSDFSSFTYLAFHKISDRFTYGVSNFSPKRFFAFINSLSKDELSKIKFSFDDGYKHLYEFLLKLLDSSDIKPILFVPTKYIGRPNSWDYSYYFKSEMHLSHSEIKELAKRGVQLGSHTHSHINLTSLSEARIMDELKHSKEILEDITGTKITSLSYPFGQTNTEIINLLPEIGYSRAFTMKFPEDSDESFRIGRIPVYSFDTRYTLMQKIQKGRLYRIEKLKSVITSRLSLGTALLQRIKSE